MNRINKEYITGKGFKITLSNNETKYVMQLIRSLGKLLVKKEDLIIFLDH